MPRDPNLGRYPWCGAPYPGWSECPAREKCIKGKQKICTYPERRSEYYGEKFIYERGLR